MIHFVKDNLHLNLKLNPKIMELNYQITNYLKHRIIKRSVLISLIIGAILSGLQIIQGLIPIVKYGNIFLESPYTRWLSIDPFTFGPIMFFILLPLMASIPAATILKEDLTSGLLLQIKTRIGLNRLLLGYGLAALIGGFLVVAIPLLTNFLTYFLFLPNIRPDFLINENLMIIHENTMFVDLFYSHPLIHGLLSILFTSLWGGLFSVLTTSISLWIKSKFLMLFSSMIFQTFLLIGNLFIKLPHQISYVPFDFLKETASSPIDIRIVILTTVIVSFTTFLLLIIGRNKKIVW